MTDDSFAAIARNPLWLAHRYDPGHDAVHFRAVSRLDHRNAIFLTDQDLPPSGEPVVLRRREAARAVEGFTAPIHFIFHSAFCCSTMMARAIDRHGWAMGLKEPVILNDLVGWRRRGATPSDLRSVLSDVLTLLARPFGPNEAIVLKPSNIVNGFAMEMMAQRPSARALLMYAPLRDFLISVAKKGLDGRLFARRIFLNLLQDGLVRSGFSQDDLFQQTDLQIAALGWLAQQDLFHAMALRFGPARVRTLSTPTLLNEPHATMDNVARLFGLPADTADIEAIVAGPGFTTHSKNGSQFGARQRQSEYAEATVPHVEEIDKVCSWLQSVAESIGIPTSPGADLLTRVT